MCTLPPECPQWDMTCRAQVIDVSRNVKAVIVATPQRGESGTFAATKCTCENKDEERLTSGLFLIPRCDFREQQHTW